MFASWSSLTLVVTKFGRTRNGPLAKWIHLTNGP